MKIISWHGNGDRHRTWTDVQLTAEPNTWWIPQNRAVYEANGHTWSSPYDVLAWFPAGKYYQVFILLKPQATEYYCNVIAPVDFAKYEGTDIEFIDLDIDVFVTKDSVAVLDEAEFEARKAAYQPEWITGVYAARAELVDLAEAGVGVFSPASAMRWRDIVASGKRRFARDS